MLGNDARLPAAWLACCLHALQLAVLAPLTHPLLLLLLPLTRLLSAEGMVPTGCQWVDCSHFVAPDTLQQHSRPHIGAVGSATAEPADQSGAAAAAAAGGSEPMQVDGAEPAAGATGSEAAAAPADGTADFSRMDAAATAAWQLSSAPAEAAAAVMQAAAAEAPATAAVYCPVTCGWTHLHCFPAEFQQSVQEATPICISSQAASDVSTRLAAVCSAGLLPLGSVPEGARAGSSTAGGEGASSSATTIPLSLLVVRGAAVASPADCRAHAPAYSPEQRLQLRAALSAALHVLHRCVRRCMCSLCSSVLSACSMLSWSPVIPAGLTTATSKLTHLPNSPVRTRCSCFEPLPDSRTGADMLPWLLRGAVLVPGEADYSAFNTAVLYAGPVVVGVGKLLPRGSCAVLSGFALLLLFGRAALWAGRNLFQSARVPADRPECCTGWPATLCNHSTCTARLPALSLCSRVPLLWRVGRAAPAGGAAGASEAQRAGPPPASSGGAAAAGRGCQGALLLPCGEGKPAALRDLPPGLNCLLLFPLPCQASLRGSLPVCLTACRPPTSPSLAWAGAVRAGFHR